MNALIEECDGLNLRRNDNFVIYLIIIVKNIGTFNYFARNLNIYLNIYLSIILHSKDFFLVISLICKISIDLRKYEEIFLTQMIKTNDFFCQYQISRECI